MSQARLPLLHRPTRQDTCADGRWKAIGKAWFDELNDAIREFHKLGTSEARAAFADSWIGIWARDFDRAWPMVYELLRLIDEQKLYSDPRRVGPSAPGGKQHHGERIYETFADYFTDRVGQPFRRWAELERTYRYAKRYAPELFELALSDAARQMQELNEKDKINLELHPHGGDRRSEAWIKNDNTKNDVNLEKPTGNSVAKALRRLRKDRPDIHARVLMGELSPHGGMIDAGFRKRGKSRAMSGLERLRRAWKRASSEDRATFLREVSEECSP